METTNLIIHIGLHKTATTLIQLILNQNKEILLNLYKINYIKWTIKTQNISEELLEKKLKNNIKIGYINLISFEGLIPFYWFYKSDDLFDSGLQKIYSISNKNNYETSIILTLREQVSYIESYYIQQLRQNKKFKFNEFIKNNIDIYNLNYYDLINKIKKKFSNVKYIFYELLFEKDIEDNEKYYFEKFMSLFSNIDINCIDFVKENICERNIGIGKDKIKYFMETNDIKQIKMLRKKFQSNPTINYYKKLMSPELKTKLIDYYKESNAKIGLKII